MILMSGVSTDKAIALPLDAYIMSPIAMAIDPYNAYLN